MSGRNLRLSLPRRLVCDLVHFGHKVPTVPVQRVINVAGVEALRAQMDPRPSWCALFTKAYALVGRDFPEFRRAYLPFPWARLYEHPDAVASIAIEREFQGENGVFFAHIAGPEHLDLPTLDGLLRHFKDDDIDSIPDYGWSLFIARLPLPLRRLAWWYVTHARGYRKATWLGTFGVSVYSSLGAESLHPISPLTTTMNYGVIDEKGDVTARIVYDHRVMDGSTVARALERLEKVMNRDIVDEMRSLLRTPSVSASAPAPRSTEQVTHQAAKSVIPTGQ